MSNATSSSAGPSYVERIIALEAENERLRWMLDAAIALSAHHDGFPGWTIAEVRYDLESRWTRREI